MIVQTLLLVGICISHACQLVQRGVYENRNLPYYHEFQINHSCEVVFKKLPLATIRGVELSGDFFYWD